MEAMRVKIILFNPIETQFSLLQMNVTQKMKLLQNLEESLMEIHFNLYLYTKDPRKLKTQSYILYQSNFSLPKNNVIKTAMLLHFHRQRKGNSM